jgi:hypothetical protein
MSQVSLSRIHNDLTSVGWSELNIDCCAQFVDDILKLAHHLGTPMGLRRRKQIIGTLKPHTAKSAHPNSLSSRFSMGEFPLHNDTAHWSTPCRYVLLACANAGTGRRRTRLLDFQSIDLTPEDRLLLHTEPMRVQNGRYSFYSTVLSKDREFIRFDPGCMAPTSSRGCFVKVIVSGDRLGPQVHEVEWKPGMVLVIDNWRVLHGRGVASEEDQDRTLLRILVS